MRTVQIAAFLMGCVTSPTDPTIVATHDVHTAVAAWREDPSALGDVSTATASAMRVPAGDASLDLPLAEALSEVLLRPDLARPRVVPHLANLSTTQEDVWLDVLLREGDLPRLAIELQARRGVRVDPAIAALQAASAQSREHREITWVRAVYAHDAGALAERQLTYGRKSIERGMPSPSDAMRVLLLLVPGWDIEAVTTRAPLPTDPDPLLSAGVITANGGGRIVQGYATNKEGPEALIALFAALDPSGQQQSVGMVVSLRSPHGNEVLLCNEGSWRGPVLWFDSTCSPARTQAWLNATDRWIEMGPESGRSKAILVWSDALVESE
ncbi:MAG: hypothetical protein ACI9MC_001081 [Kiritimatiellia bacterium]|jgi:hypothetical protein